MLFRYMKWLAASIDNDPSGPNPDLISNSDMAALKPEKTSPEVYGTAFRTAMPAASASRKSFS